MPDDNDKSPWVAALIAAAMQSGAAQPDAEHVARNFVQSCDDMLRTIATRRDLTEPAIVAMLGAVDRELSDQSEAVSDVQRQIRTFKRYVAKLAGNALEMGDADLIRVTLETLSRCDDGPDVGRRSDGGEQVEMDWRATA